MCCANAALISADCNGCTACMPGLCQTENVNATLDYFDELPNYRNYAIYHGLTENVMKHCAVQHMNCLPQDQTDRIENLLRFFGALQTAVTHILSPVRLFINVYDEETMPLFSSVTAGANVWIAII